MRDTLKEFIEEKLERFPFVNWDRYIYDKETNSYSFYGWIDREDSYKDFIVLNYSAVDGDWDVTTSSAEKHNEIMEVLNLKPEDTNTCIRIEKSFDIINMIKLK